MGATSFIVRFVRLVAAAVRGSGAKAPPLPPGTKIAVEEGKVMPRGGKRQRCGRPALGSRARSKVLGVRVTPAEHAEVMADARISGVKLSVLLRSRVLRDRGAECRER